MSTAHPEVCVSVDLKALLRPRSVAVIGASNRRGAIGAEILHNLVRHGFRGPVYPIHPSARSVLSLRAWPDVLAVPDTIDLAVIAVPQPLVLGVMQQCADKGVGAAIVISAGFREAGPDGLAAEQELLALAREAGIRLVGPNCLGVVSTDPDTCLNATFAPTYPPAGTVAVASQSGALGVAMLDYARDLNIGISDFVSMGNKADVSATDLLAWWGRDPHTRVVLLYLESFGNPEHFANTARELTRRKPVVAVKSGRSTRGLLAAGSHTGSLAGSDSAVQALVDETGIIRVDTVDELFDVAAFLAHQPVPTGDRVGILTNAGGPGILATDAAEAWGLQVPDLPESTRAELASFLPAEASVANPVDMIASATPEQFERAGRAMLASGAIDALVVLFVPPIVTDPTEVGAAIGRASAGTALPVLSCFMGRHGVPEALSSLQAAHVPSYAFPESAVRVLARAARYGRWRQQPRGELPELPGADTEAAQRILDRAQPADQGWLSAADVAAVLDTMGIRRAPERIAHSAGEAAAAARSLGFPVVLKLLSDTLTHKSDVGGVRVDLRDETEVFDAWEAIASALEERGQAEAMQGVLVQPMVGGGVETILGLVRDPAYGPLLMFGLGGVHVELMEDVGFRLAPLTDVSAAALVCSVKGFPLLSGWRGAPPADVRALEGMLLRLSRLATSCVRVAEVDLNPVMALTDGAVAVDARIRLAPPGATDAPAPS